MIKIFPILLIFYHKLVLREGVFGTAASFIADFEIHKLWSSNVLFKKLLFEQTSPLSFFFAKREIWKIDEKWFFDKVSMFIIHESYKR